MSLSSFNPYLVKLGVYSYEATAGWLYLTVNQAEKSRRWFDPSRRSET